MLDSSSPNIRVAGEKRLLPAFEPSSSPPRFKQSRKKLRTENVDDENRYPTPLPSSSIGVLPSSPPAAEPVSRRPQLRRTQSTVSERAPLAAVPSITLPASGDTILLGRSSNSSHYRLSANRLISRVHIEAKYVASTKSSKAKIQLKCTGWNGVKVHCQGRAWDLQKDDIFESETEHAEIMLDVHDSRVVIAWPGVPSANSNNILASPATALPSARVTRSPSADWERGVDENADPWESARRINSRHKLTPVSPTPRRMSSNALPQPSMSMAETFLDIYEDDPADETHIELPKPPKEPLKENTRLQEKKSFEEPFTDIIRKDDVALSFDSDSILPPMSLFSTAAALENTPPPPSFLRRRASSSPLSIPSISGSSRRSVSVSPNKAMTLQNHLTNQLAFSRVHTMPLSELFENLPTALAATVTKEKVHEILLNTACIGEIKRVGKDAAGKPLEDQYYYMMEEDTDEGRKRAVGGRAGVRSCRKTHKQYYWKKPKKLSS